LHKLENKIQKGSSADETLLDLILRARIEEAEFSTVEEDDIISVMLDLLLAGTDTTASTAGFLVAELVLKPELQNRLQAELDRVIGRDSSPTVDDLPNLPFLDALVLETLRHHPPGPLGMGHVTSEEIAFDKYVVPANVAIMANIWAIHHDPTEFPEPFEFKPDRWLENPGLKDSKYFIPFSVGPRMCVARNLANSEARLIAANLFHTFRISPPEGKKFELKEVPGITTSPKNYQVVIHLRN